MSDEKGMKHDKEKVQLELLSPIWLNGVGQVLTFGAKKYAAHNWRRGIEISRLLGACLRHVFAFLGGEDKDPESGLSHLYHASCCLMFASELHETTPAMDDRYRKEIKAPEFNPILRYHCNECNKPHTKEELDACLKEHSWVMCFECKKFRAEVPPGQRFFYSNARVCMACAQKYKYFDSVGPDGRPVPLPPSDSGIPKGPFPGG